MKKLFTLLLTMLVYLMSAHAQSIITFADQSVKAICVANWDTDSDGELSTTEAEAVTDLGGVFKNKVSITSFNELKFFTGLTSIGAGAFSRCVNLSYVTIPKNVTSIGQGAFYPSCSSLRIVKSEISTPFAVNAFDSYSATLVVPKETRADYMSVDGWLFANIFEEGETNYDWDYTVVR